jgi:hypothetical protein
MKYKITITFKDGYQNAFGIDGYSTRSGVLELYTYNGPRGQLTKIQIFPLLDIKAIEILDCEVLA